MSKQRPNTTNPPKTGPGRVTKGTPNKPDRAPRPAAPPPKQKT